MANLAKYIVQLEAQTAKYKRELNTASRRLNRFQKQQKKSVNALNRAWLKFGASLAAALSGARFAAAAKDALDLADNLSKLTDRLGGTVEAFSELRFVAERSGLQFNTLTMGLQRMQRRVAEAAVGLGEARGALKELGLDARQLTSLSIDRQFEVIAESLSQVTSDADKTRLAMKLFDSEGVALLQTMKNGAAGIQQLRKRARELGVTLSTESAQAAVEARDAITDLTSSWEAFTLHLSTKAAPWLASTADGLRRLTGGFTAAEQVELFTEQLNNLTRNGLTPADAAVRNTVESLTRYLQILGDVEKAAIDPFPELQEINVNTAGLDARREKTKAYINTVIEMDRRYRAFIENYRLEQRRALASDVFETASKDLESFIERQESLAEVQAKFAKTNAELDAFLQSGAAETKKFDDAVRDLGLTFESAFENVLLEGGKVQDLLRGLAKDVLRIFARQTIVKPLAGFLTGLIPGRAKGGPVTAGAPYLVGEKGPELFVPGASGAIVPSGQMGGNFNFVTNINSTGALQPEKLIPILEANNRKVKGEFLDELNRGKYD